MERILAAVDLTDATDDVIEMAASLSQKEHARLCCVYVEPGIATADPAWEGGPHLPPRECAVEQGRLALERLRDSLAERGIEVDCMHRLGPPVHELQEAVEAFHPDLIVMGAHERGPLFHLLLGSVRDRFLRHAPCPVMVVPHGHHATHH